MLFSLPKSFTWYVAECLGRRNKQHFVKKKRVSKSYYCTWTGSSIVDSEVLWCMNLSGLLPHIICWGRRHSFIWMITGWNEQVLPCLLRWIVFICSDRVPWLPAPALSLAALYLSVSSGFFSFTFNVSLPLYPPFSLSQPWIFPKTIGDVFPNSNKLFFHFFELIMVLTSHSFTELSQILSGTLIQLHFANFYCTISSFVLWCLDKMILSLLHSLC